MGNISKRGYKGSERAKLKWKRVSFGSVRPLEFVHTLFLSSGDLTYTSLCLHASPSQISHTHQLLLPSWRHSKVCHLFICHWCFLNNVNIAHTHPSSIITNDTASDQEVGKLDLLRGIEVLEIDAEIPQHHCQMGYKRMIDQVSSLATSSLSYLTWST